MSTRALLAAAFIAGALAVVAVVIVWIAVEPPRAPSAVSGAPLVTDVPAPEAGPAMSLPEQRDGDDDRADSAEAPLPESEDDVIPPTEEGADADADRDATNAASRDGSPPSAAGAASGPPVLPGGQRPAGREPRSPATASPRP